MSIISLVQSRKVVSKQRTSLHIQTEDIDLLFLRPRTFIVKKFHLISQKVFGANNYGDTSSVTLVYIGIVMPPPV